MDTEDYVMKGEILSLFPTAVARYELGRDFTDEELDFVWTQNAVENKLNLYSADSYVFKQKALSGLNEFSKRCIEHYLKSIICPENPVSLRITQSWLNYTKRGQSHHLHKHLNSFLSGVLYIEAEEEKDQICFVTPCANDSIDLTPRSLNRFNSKEWLLSVKKGDLLLFPSSLGHFVPTTDTERRVSLSFNTFPVGYVGSEEALGAVHL